MRRTGRRRRGSSGVKRSSSGRRRASPASAGTAGTANLAVAPDGSVFPCVMARPWAVGDVADQSLDEVVHGDAPRAHAARDPRHRMAAEVVGAPCQPAYCHSPANRTCPARAILCCATSRARRGTPRRSCRSDLRGRAGRATGIRLRSGRFSIRLRRLEQSADLRRPAAISAKRKSPRCVASFPIWS
jgi:Iron-sulfur cluster-binding domain